MAPLSRRRRLSRRRNASRSFEKKNLPREKSLWKNDNISFIYDSTIIDQKKISLYRHLFMTKRYGVFLVELLHRSTAPKAVSRVKIKVITLYTRLKRGHRSHWPPAARVVRGCATLQDRIYESLFEGRRKSSMILSMRHEQSIILFDWTISRPSVFTSNAARNNDAKVNTKSGE